MRLPKRVVGGVLCLGLIAAVGGTAPSLHFVGLSVEPAASVFLADVPPPTPVPPFGSPSPFPTALATPAPSTTAPRLGAPSAVLEDLDTGQVLFSKSPRKPRPVASVTKLMTALLVLDRLNPAQVVTVGGDAASQTGARLGLRVGERITVRNLMYGLLLSSANDAAVALSDAVAGSVPAFVRLMNRRAAAMGLTNTRFASPTGLDDRGLSTATDLAAILRAAYADPMFGAVVRTKFWDVPSPAGLPRHIQNRNALLWLYPGAIGVKTGFTAQAGHCLVAAAARNGLRMAVVVLGDPAEAFNDAAALLNFGLLEFQRVTLVRRGDAVETVKVGGEPVPGVAGADLVRLVRTDRVAAVVRRFQPVAGIALPITAGYTIGWDVAEVGGETIGSVPVTAAASTSAGGQVVSGPAQGIQARPAVAVLLRLLSLLLRALAGAFL